MINTHVISGMTRVMAEEPWGSSGYSPGKYILQGLKDIFTIPAFHFNFSHCSTLKLI